MGDNPFEDPSSGGAYGEDFSNPFESGSAYGGGGFPGQDEEVGGFPGQDQYSQVNIHTDEQDQLDAKESALRKREAQIAARERAVAKGARVNSSGQVRNWPCPGKYALAYHNINEDIPQRDRTLVRKFYAYWMWICLCFIMNWLAVIIGVGAKNLSVDSLAALWATLYMVIGIPASWKCWYRMLYYGCKGDKGSRWVCFFIMFVLQLCFDVVLGLGIKDIGSAGLFVMIDAFAKDEGAAGVVNLIALAMWGLSLLLGFFLLKLAHSTWRESGNPQQIKKEATRAVAKAAVEEATTGGGWGDA